MKDDTGGSIEQLIARQMKAKEADEAKIDDIEKFGKAINSMFATAEGMLFGKEWLHQMKIFHHPDSADGVALVESRGMKKFYLKIIRPNLNKEVRQQLEGQI